MTDNLTLTGKQKRIVQLTAEKEAAKHDAGRAEVERLTQANPQYEYAYRINQFGHIELSCKPRA